MNEEELKNMRKELKLFTIPELCSMFNCGRANIDYAINTGQLDYLSPNNRDRYIYLKDFLEFITKKKGNISRQEEPLPFTQPDLGKSANTNNLNTPL